MTELDSFRSETRDWLETNCPQEMRQPIRSEEDYCWGGRNWAFQSEAQRQWLDAMAERGWTVPDWPKDYGGGGLSADEARILKAEMARIGARSPLVSFGISMLGPALLKFGTEEQKRHYLPQIARGEEVLLFLERSAAAPRGAYVVSGFAQGKLSITADAGGVKWAVTDAAPGRDGGNAERPGRSRRRLSDLRDAIRRQLQERAR